MDLPSIVRFILPKEDRFFEILEAQGNLAHEAATVLARFKDDSVPCEDVRSDIQTLEHKGDCLVSDMETALARTFVTPMDREDLQRLSSKLDDVVDVANVVIRECVLFGVARPTAPMSELIGIFCECTRVLASAVLRLRKHEYEKLLEEVRVVRKLEKDGDNVFRAAVSALFQDATINAKVLIREKQVLGGLEHAIDECDHVAGTLTNLAVKLG